MAAKLLNLLPSHGARERRERWQFDIRFTQCDGLSGLGDLSSNLGSVEGEVCVQLARHAKVAVSQCAAVAGGSASWGADAGVLSLVCTLKAHEGGARVDMYAVPQPCRSRAAAARTAPAYQPRAFAYHPRAYCTHPRALTPQAAASTPSRSS